MNSDTNKSSINAILKFDSTEEEIDFAADVIHLRTMSRISCIMEEKSISRSEFANKLGVSRAFVSQLFSGERNLNLKLLAKMQRVLKVNFEINPLQTWHSTDANLTMDHPLMSKQVRAWFGKQSDLNGYAPENLEEAALVS